MANKDISTTDREQGSYMTALKDLEKKMETMFQNLWNNPFNRDENSDFFSLGSLSNIPKVDVVDRDTEIYVEAELPGIDKKDVDISVSGRQLVIKAETSAEKKEEEGNYLRQEISKKEFYRSIVLPTSDIDESKAKTSFKNGVLKLTIPKKKTSHRKKIEIK